jgi:methylmalonyl-CoA/ethylmalonyl-CoA epimerase
MEIDHICFAVKDTIDAVKYWECIFGYTQMTSTIENAAEKVYVTFLKKENSITIKLIEPRSDNESLINFVKREGAFHHICFKCRDINEKIGELTGKGLRLLTPPRPGEAFNNHDIAFLLAKYGMNVELIDTEEKAGLLES